MTTSSLIQLTELFPLFPVCIERGDSIQAIVIVGTAENEERAVHCDDRIVKKVRSLTEYLLYSFLPMLCVKMNFRIIKKSSTEHGNTDIISERKNPELNTSENDDKEYSVP